MLETLLLGLLLILQGAALMAAFVAEARLKQLGLGLEDAQRVAEDEIRSAAETIRAAVTATDVVHVGVSGVKTAHQTIADIPFTILENIPATRAGSKAVRGVHDAIAGGIYGALSAVNKGVGQHLQKKAEAAKALPPLPPAKPAQPEPPAGKPGKTPPERR